jgi:hypothetical protein
MNELLTRVFRVWSFTVSHNILIIRSPLKFPDENGYDESFNHNIDIEFESVEYMDIPTWMNGICIKEVNNNGPSKLQYLLADKDLKIFEIRSQQGKFHIVASSYQIGKNKWVSEDRVSNMSLSHDEVIANSVDRAVDGLCGDL